MTSAGIDQLNKRQKQCLRLYYANYGIKEIGIELNLSTNTVNEHLRNARRILGVDRSMQAARMLHRHENPNNDVSNSNSVERRWDDDHPDAATIAVNPAAVVRNRSNLGFLVKVGLMVAIAFGAVALAGALLVGADAITGFFVNHEIDISDPPYRQ